MRKCPNCSERNPNDAAVCRFCGQLLPGASKPVTAGPVSSPDTSRVDANSVAGPAALASGVVTALTVLLFFALRGFLPPDADRLLILAVPYFLLWWGVFALLISFLRRKNRSLRSAVGSALAYLLVGVLYIVSAISENWEPPRREPTKPPAVHTAAAATSSWLRPSATVRPTRGSESRTPIPSPTDASWILHTAQEVTSECSLMNTLTPSFQGREVCMYLTVDSAELTRRAEEARGQPYVRIVRPLVPGGSRLVGIDVPSQYFADVFQPQATEAGAGGESFCIYSAPAPLRYYWESVTVGDLKITGTILLITAQVHVCPEGMP